MVCKCIQSRTWSTKIVWARGNPFMVSGNIDMLVLIESGEWKASWSGLPLFIGGILFVKKRTERLRIFECSSAHGANGQHRTCNGEAQDGRDNLHLGYNEKGYEGILELRVASCDQRKEVIYLPDAPKRTKLGAYHSPIFQSIRHIREITVTSIGQNFDIHPYTSIKASSSNLVSGYHKRASFHTYTETSLQSYFVHLQILWTIDWLKPSARRRRKVAAELGLGSWNVEVPLVMFPSLMPS